MTTPATSQSRGGRWPTNRLEAFSDGVFGFAATLLVVDLTVNNIGEVTTDAQLWAGLVELAPNILSFIVSFLLICLLWIQHDDEFRSIAWADRGLVAFNSLRLMAVVFIPFTTSIAGEYDHLMLGRVLLPLNFLAIVVIAAAGWWYATDTRRGLLAPDAGLDIPSSRRDGLVAVVLGVLVVPLAALVGPIAFAIFALDGPISAFLSRRAR